ncbi:MAG: hypothetical protein A2174_02215 [Candidatus Portnoybacteria bacterium RBG_13_41_18]|uniref:Phospholipase C/D domain-containing protein n=1 Tax=Candidatus Portnoybacteria bacterium RBG_13_41_18 TaxID=1801991 RepID=A0A1G2F9Q3_9BACT|nr:MAG: hypothetical protein A2174_02215 [Candidatus Portnoybacteria bacterium RBG_13_41_18]
MDLISHGLWGGIITKAANKRKFTKKPIKVRWFIFWSIVPDVFTFTIIFMWFFGSILAGFGSLASLPHYQITEPMPENTHLIINLTHWLYNFSHSLVVFLAVFSITSLRKRGALWVMTGWLAHILIDIPTHSYKFFPTPFLWPLSDWKLDGISWSSPWFEIINYSLIAIVYFWLYRRWLKKQG